MTAVATAPNSVARVSPQWRAVGIPAEHGGWGLTLEPVLLGLVVAFSWSGLAIGLAAFLAFLVRTPLKLALVAIELWFDVRSRGRRLVLAVVVDDRVIVGACVVALVAATAAGALAL